jgi:hypothetical protein
MGAENAPPRSRAHGRRSRRPTARRRGLATGAERWGAHGSRSRRSGLLATVTAERRGNRHPRAILQFVSAGKRMSTRAPLRPPDRVPGQGKIRPLVHGCTWIRRRRAPRDEGSPVLTLRRRHKDLHRTDLQERRPGRFAAGPRERRLPGRAGLQFAPRERRLPGCAGLQFAPRERRLPGRAGLQFAPPNVRIQGSLRPAPIRYALAPSSFSM